MAWSYSGDPSTSELDEYRFLIGDTNTNEQLLQNEEIQYILSQSTDKNMRLMSLFERLVLHFSRMATERKLGPMSEKYTDRLAWFKERYAYHKKNSSQLGVPVMATPHDPCFDIGMHDYPGLCYSPGCDSDV